MLIISVIGFSIKHNFGDPVRELVGERVTPEERDQIRERLGLNDPFLVQYGRFLVDALHGNLGRSFFFKRPVTEVIHFQSTGDPGAGILCFIDRDTAFRPHGHFTPPYTQGG